MITQPRKSIFAKPCSFTFTSKKVTLSKEKGKTHGSGLDVPVGVGSVVHISISLIWPATAVSEIDRTRMLSMALVSCTLLS